MVNRKNQKDMEYSKPVVKPKIVLSKKCNSIKLVVICIAIIVIGIIVLLVIDQNRQRKIVEQQTLAEKYLAELNYDDAIEAFQKILKIDFKQVNAYLRLGQLYLDRKDYENALKILNKGVNKTNDEEIQQLLKVVEEKQKEISALYEDAEKILKPLYECFANNDIDGARALLIQEKYIEFTSRVKKLDEKIVYQLENKNTLKIYTNAVGDSYVYYGTLLDDKRDGSGILLSASDSEHYSIYIGEWKADYPNGEGEYTNTADTSNRVIVSVISGKFVDGYAEGLITLIHDVNGDSCRFQYRVNKGIAEKLYADDDWSNYVFAVSDDGLVKLGRGRHSLDVVHGAYKIN